MKKTFVCLCMLLVVLLLAPTFSIIAVEETAPTTVKETMDNIVTRLYEEKDDEYLDSLNDEIIHEFITDDEENILRTEYWTFDINVPVIVSVMHHQGQNVNPFWLNVENGFKKTELIVSNDSYTYDVWQKTFDANRVELGINGFDRHREHYFVSVAPVNPEDKLELTNFFPQQQQIETLEIGSFTYHDWDELVLEEVPDELIGNILLPTIRGRAREAHLIGAFRDTKYPATKTPDQIVLNWKNSPKTTQAIQWRTNTEVNDGIVKYSEKRDNYSDIKITANKKLMEDRLLRNDRYSHIFEAELTNLKPATTYTYKVGSVQYDSWSDMAEFTTAPESPAPFSFIDFGDTHIAPEWGEMLQNTFIQYPNLAFYTISGDLVNTGLYRDEWDCFFEYSGDVFNYIPLMPSIGNHDSQDGLGAQMFLDVFQLPKNGPATMQKERTYSFEYSNAIFLMLDVTEPIAPQTGWIEEQLSNTNAMWKFAVFHFPPYFDKEEYQDIRELWGNVFDKYNLDMVFSGHVHTYARSKPMKAGVAVSPTEGTIYITSIAVPNPRDTEPEPEYTDFSVQGQMLYQKVDIDDNILTYQAINSDGEVIDSLEIIK